MIDELDFVLEKGKHDQGEIIVFALSTCGFCRRGLQFLRENSITFRYIYVDHLDMDIKERLKSYLADTYRTRVAYPFLVLNGKETMHGFDQEEWERKLLK